jgi:hypothetical protein
MLSESCKGNFAGTGSGSMGMRLDELANSSFLQEGRLEGDLRRRGKEEEGVKLIFEIPLNGRRSSATRRARGNPFWVSQSVAFRKSVLELIDVPKKG